MSQNDISDREVVNSRLFPAPRDQVFLAFRDPEQLKLWWGPNGFTNTFDTFELRPGGAWKYVMHGPDGTDYRNESNFLEVVEGERIVLFHRLPMHRFRMAMTYEDANGGTLVTWKMHFETVEECEKVRPWVEAGNEQNFDRLAAHLADVSKREVRVGRVIAAPRELVWKVWTDPAHVGNWWGPDGFSLTTFAMDVRPGGVWRYVMHGPDGRDYQNRITYLEVAEPERLVYLHGGGEGELEPVNFRTTVTFAERDGKTHLTMQAIFPTAADRERVVRDFKADVGAEQHVANLAEYVESLRV